MKNKVLFYFLKELRTATVKVPRGTNFDTIQAGTPLSEAGAIANDATAYGIVMHNHQKEWTREATINGYANVTVIVAGYIDEAAAESSCGLEYTDALKGALNDIVFIDGEIGSGGGSGTPTEKVERTFYIPEQTFTGTEDKGAYRTSIESNFSELGNPDVLNVEFDGTLYSAPLRANGTSYGDNDGSFTEFPFFIQAETSEVMVADSNSHIISAYTGNIIYSGASIPDYTAEDKGKVLTLAEQTESVLVIPEQTVARR